MIDGKARSPSFSVFQTEKPCDHRVLFFDQSGILIPKKDCHEIPIGLRIVAPARQNLDHVLFAIKGLPGIFVGLGPFLGRHAWMLDRGVKRIAFVKVGIHPFAAVSHFTMFVGAWQRGQHEKGRLIGPDFVHQEPDVFGHLLSVIPRKTDDVTGMHDYPGIMPLSNNLTIFLDVVLFFPFGLQVFRVYTFHSNENLSTTRFGRQLNEVFWLACQVDLHHERDLDAFLSKLDDGFEGFAPKFLPGKIVIGEEVKGNAVLRVISAEERGNAFRAPFAHLPPLHIDDGAKGARKGAAAGSVCGPESRVGEMVHGFWTTFWKRRGLDIDEALQILGKAIDGLQPAVEKIGEDLFPLALDFTGYDADGLANEFLDVRLLLAEHVDGAAGMEATDDDRDVFSPKAPCDVESAWKLVCLHSH